MNDGYQRPGYENGIGSLFVWRFLLHDGGDSDGGIVIGVSFGRDGNWTKGKGRGRREGGVVKSLWVIVVIALHR